MARLLKPLLGELVLSEEARLPCSSPTKRQQTSAPPTMWMPVVEIILDAAYADFSERLRKCGFTEDAGEAILICRWRQQEDDFGRHAARREDPRIFPTDGTSQAPPPPVEHELGPDLRVRIVTGVYFCATKLEAFAGRGKGDYQSSFISKI